MNVLSPNNMCGFHNFHNKECDIYPVEFHSVYQWFGYLKDGCLKQSVEFQGRARKDNISHFAWLLCIALLQTKYWS